MKFESLALEWYETKKKYLKESTGAYYLFELQNYIIPALGKVDIKDLTEDVIQEAVYKWQAEGKNDKSIKKSTITNLVMLIKQIIKYAVKKKLHGTNSIGNILYS